MKGRAKPNTVHCCIGHGNCWPEPVHAIIKRTKANHPALSWLRVKMSCHNFASVDRPLHGDVVKKSMEGVESRDFKDSVCDCADRKLIDGKCPYNDLCRNKCLIHQLAHKKSGKIHRGATARNLKARTQEHFADLENAVKSKGEEKQS